MAPSIKESPLLQSKNKAADPNGFTSQEKGVKSSVPTCGHAGAWLQNEQSEEM